MEGYPRSSDSDPKDMEGYPRSSDSMPGNSGGSPEDMGGYPENPGGTPGEAGSYPGNTDVKPENFLAIETSGGVKGHCQTEISKQNRQHSAACCLSLFQAKFAI